MAKQNILEEDWTIIDNNGKIIKGNEILSLIRESVDIVIGDDGRRSGEVIEVLQALIYERMVKNG